MNNWILFSFYIIYAIHESALTVSSYSWHSTNILNNVVFVYTQATTYFVPSVIAYYRWFPNAN